jgi:serine/threonine protein kinase
MNSAEPEKMFLHYRLIDKIGSGGMGEVFKAEDTKLSRIVALKLLPAAANENLTAKRRFLKEAQAASALNHPNIVTIHAIEEAEGVDFIVMEFIEGQTLKALIEQDGALTLAKLLDIGIQVAEALEAAHEVGLIHRDIKPANILVTPRGRAKVLDFGLAKIVRTIVDGPGNKGNEAPTLMNLTDEGTVLGTTAYMSPEQTRGETLDAQARIKEQGAEIHRRHQILQVAIGAGYGFQLEFQFAVDGLQ